MNRQTIFIIVLVLVLGMTGYLWYGYLHPTTQEHANQQSAAAQLANINQVGNIRLDTSLFQDPFFNSLALPQIIPQPDIAPGRQNPFIPF